MGRGDTLKDYAYSDDPFYWAMDYEHSIPSMYGKQYSNMCFECGFNQLWRNEKNYKHLNYDRDDYTRCFSCRIPNSHQWNLRNNLEDEIKWLGNLAEKSKIGFGDTFDYMYPNYDHLENKDNKYSKNSINEKIKINCKNADCNTILNLEKNKDGIIKCPECGLRFYART